jgi:hypothetical protein
LSSQWSLSFWLSHQCSLCISLLPHSYIMCSPSHPPWLEYKLLRGDFITFQIGLYTQMQNVLLWLQHGPRITEQAHVATTLHTCMCEDLGSSIGPNTWYKSSPADNCWGSTTFFAIIIQQ